MSARPTTIDAYIETLPEAVQPRIAQLRTLITAVLPGTAEAVKWGSPAFVDADGMILVMISAHKHHSNVVVTPSALEANRDTLAGFTLGKGSVQIPHDQPIPAELIQNLVAWRLREYRDHGVKWM